MENKQDYTIKQLKKINETLQNSNMEQARKLTAISENMETIMILISMIANDSNVESKNYFMNWTIFKLINSLQNFKNDIQTVSDELATLEETE